jgi:hypothetical protein
MTTASQATITPPSNWAGHNAAVRKTASKSRIAAKGNISPSSDKKSAAESTNALTGMAMKPYQGNRPSSTSSGSLCLGFAIMIAMLKTRSKWSGRIQQVDKLRVIGVPCFLTPIDPALKH